MKRKAKLKIPNKELPKESMYKKICSFKFFKYTKEQLFLKEKIKLGIVLSDEDYQELYYDLSEEFGNTELDEFEVDSSVSRFLDSLFGKGIDKNDDGVIKNVYLDYLNKKYNCTLRFQTIKNLIANNI
jgi:hypothetical protein